VEGGQLAGDPDSGGGLVAGDRAGLGGDEPVQALSELVGEQPDRRDRLPARVGSHTAGFTQEMWTHRHDRQLNGYTTNIYWQKSDGGGRGGLPVGQPPRKAACHNSHAAEQADRDGGGR
jgi:hypothetical protein